MSILREGLERASRGITLQRRLPARFGGGPILVTPESALRYWHWDLERVDPALLHAAEELVAPGDTVWDIGANVGLFAFTAAALCGKRGRVLAIEPDIKLATLLQKSNNAPSTRGRVDVLCIAVAQTVGISTLNIASRGRSSNSLGDGNSQTGGTRERHTILSVTLDWLLDLYPSPSVLKIDVEGCEHEVLQGAKKILQKSRPRIVCEVNERNRADVTHTLEAWGYVLYDGDQPKSNRGPLRSAAWNTIAYPAESQTE